jgi:hypothetical protein
MKLKVLATVFMAWTFIFQNVAFAMKPIEVSAQADINKLKAQKITDTISRRYNNLSDTRKLRLLKRTERRLTKATRKLDRMSNRKFQSKLSKMMNDKNSDQKTVKIDAEESEILSGLNSKVQIATVAIDKFLFTQKIEDSLFAVRGEMDALKNGEKKINGTKVLIYGIIAGLVVLSFFSTAALVALGLLVFMASVVFGLLILIGYAFADALGNIVGQVK